MGLTQTAKSVAYIRNRADRCDVFRYDPVKNQKMVKLPEGPVSVFCDMNGRGVVVGCKTDQMPVTNPFNGTYSASFQENFEFVAPGS